jgi:hypothetical protein
MAKTGKSGKGGRTRERQERRFAPLPSTNPMVARVVGGLGAAALGVGAWAQFGHDLLDNGLPPYGFAPAALAGGAVASGIAVWLGTSGEAPLRVGAGGVGIERGKLVSRIPWHAIEHIEWDPDKGELSVRGDDETGTHHALTVSTKTHPRAAAWIVKEARDRIPDRVDVPEEARGLPAAQATDGQILGMDAVQVVGKRCAASDKIIAYEPDARVCPRCERVYHKDAVPQACACGASMEGVHPVEQPV